MEDRLSSGLEKLGLAASERQLAQLRQYARMVLEFNKGYNLMKAKDEDEMVVNHLLDSLAALGHIRGLADGLSSSPSQSQGRADGLPLSPSQSQGRADSIPAATASIADIGSGGGCPGIPLAIMLDGYGFTLVERMEKRVLFLEDVRRQLDLQNVSILPVQAEKVPPESFAVTVFRAFHPFDRKTTRTLLSLTKEGGFIAAYKARSEKIAAEMESVKDLIPSYQKISLSVPFLEDHERNLVVLQKLPKK
ncbi:MAG: 16S rRNA (guanine(527)-N(7))-methyltransferase RsmG [Treponema sp.]|nr:16S rRNA (guanine(527)-N(7))-methyltransferase RsmG [Treponema sp.]